MTTTGVARIDPTDEQVLAAVAERWAWREGLNARPGRLHVVAGVTANDVAPGRARSIAPRLAKLAREGRLDRTYDDRAGDSGCFVYRPI